MGDWAIFYGTITLAVLALSLTARCPGTRRAAGYLLFSWAAYNLTRPNMAPLELASLFGYVDMVGVLVGITLYGRNGRRWSPYPDRWVHAFIACFLAQMVLHLCMTFMDGSRPYFYYLSLNLFYFGQVVSVAVPSVAWWVRRWRREAVRKAPAQPCKLRFGRCPRCGPAGMVCEVTGERTARSV